MTQQDTLNKAIEYLKYQGLVSSKTDLAEQMGANRVSVSRACSGDPSYLTADFLQRLNTTFGSIFSSSWLLTGEGSMLVENSPSEVKKTSSDVENTTSEEEDAIFLPVLNLDARGGLLSNDVVGEGEYIAEQMPFSRNVAREGDFVVNVYGDSMNPRYPSGSRVLLRPIPAWKDYIELGAAYVIELRDYRRVLKIIKRGSTRDMLTLASVNPDYEPSEVSRDFIRQVFRVVLSIQREEM